MLNVCIEREEKMRIVTYKDWPVKRQKKIGDDKLLLRFYERPPITVTLAEWAEHKGDRFFPAGVRRRNVIRARKIKDRNHEHDHTDQENFEAKAVSIAGCSRCHRRAQTCC